MYSDHGPHFSGRGILDTATEPVLTAYKNIGRYDKAMPMKIWPFYSTLALISYARRNRLV